MKFSIITINYNNCEGLRSTIESVVNQTCRDFEYIIIDGGSTDGSVDVIKQYADQIDYWVSEPDKGIYNAMNKGVAVAKGEYCLFMNSGDMFYTNDVIKQVYKKADFKSDIIEGDYFTMGQIFKLPERITGFFMFVNALCHQASFIRIELLKNEPYDEKYKISSDWIQMFKTLVLKNGTYQHIRIVVCNYDSTGISSTNRKLALDEREQWLKQIMPRRIYDDYVQFEKFEETRVPRKLCAELSGIGENTFFEKSVLICIKVIKRLHKIKNLLILKIHF